MVSSNLVCSVCSWFELEVKLALGMQSPSNRFTESKPHAANPNDSYPLSLGVCNRCGTIQLVERMPVEAVRPRFDWLTYNEPEGHLDDVADRLANLPGISASSRFIGITYKDRSLLDRLTRKGLSQTDCIATQQLGNLPTPFGLETIQACLSEAANVNQIKKSCGKADVLLVRHIVEHAANARLFLQNLKELLAPGGYIMLELPDSERILRARNYPFIWEEHICYFTESSIPSLINSAGAVLEGLVRYHYAYEDSLVVFLRFPDSPVESKVAAGPTADSLASKQLVTSFAEGFSQTKTDWQKKIAGLKNNHEKIAVFGAGHLAAKFINFFELVDLIDCVIDDHPNKAGMLMPGSGLPIVSSAEMPLRGIRICISTLSPESEVKVRIRLSSFFEHGGIFIPAFRAEVCDGL